MKPFLLNGDNAYGFKGEDELGLKFWFVIRNIIAFIQGYIKRKEKLACHSFQFTKVTISLFGGNMYDFK